MPTEARQIDFRDLFLRECESKMDLLQMVVDALIEGSPHELNELLFNVESILRASRIHFEAAKTLK